MRHTQRGVPGSSRLSTKCSYTQILVPRSFNQSALVYNPWGYDRATHAGEKWRARSAFVYLPSTVAKVRGQACAIGTPKWIQWERIQLKKKTPTKAPPSPPPHHTSKWMHSIRFPAMGRPRSTPGRFK